jgi:hypothetical protein
MRYEIVREDRLRETETEREKKKKEKGTKRRLQRRKGINVKENNTGTKHIVKERKCKEKENMKNTSK